MDHDYVPMQGDAATEMDTSIVSKKKDSKGRWCCVPGCFSGQYHFVDNYQWDFYTIYLSFVI